MQWALTVAADAQKETLTGGWEVGERKFGAWWHRLRYTARHFMRFSCSSKRMTFSARHVHASPHILLAVICECTLLHYCSQIKWCGRAHLRGEVHNFADHNVHCAIAIAFGIHTHAIVSNRHLLFIVCFITHTQIAVRVFICLCRDRVLGLGRKFSALLIGERARRLAVLTVVRVCITFMGALRSFTVVALLAASNAPQKH